MISDSRVLLLEPDRLSDDATERHRQLLRTFPDHAVRSVRVDEGWALSLTIPGDPARGVDPRIASGLAWWQSLSVGARRSPRFQLSLHDSWSLLACSEWLAGEAAAGRRVEELVILHVDQHDDLMSPLLWAADAAGTSWVEVLSGGAVDVANPAQVAAAIHSGAIGIAAWIVPLLFAVPRVSLRHLRATSRRLVAGDYLLERRLVPDERLDASQRRPAIRPVRPGEAEGAIDFRVALAAEFWLENLPPGPIILHIDCDYYNNRYDGNADWPLHGMHHDPPAEAIAPAIDQLFGAIRASAAAGRIVEVIVALSPGFFPAEYWPAAYDRIRAQCAEGV